MGDYLESLRAELLRAHKAFTQAPSVRLAAAMKQIQGKITYEERKRKKTSTAGKKAAGAAVDAGYQNRRIITVDDQTADTLRQLGKGNLSAGIRKAAGIVQTVRDMVDD